MLNDGWVQLAAGRDVAASPLSVERAMEASAPVTPLVCGSYFVPGNYGLRAKGLLRLAAPSLAAEALPAVSGARPRAAAVGAGTDAYSRTRVTATKSML